MTTNREKALELCKGVYQRSLIYGNNTIGATSLLRKAAQYQYRYIESSKNLLKRLDEHNIPYHLQLGSSGRTSDAILVIDD